MNINPNKKYKFIDKDLINGTNKSTKNSIS